MLRVALALWGAAAKRVRSSQVGMSMVETMVAAVILSAGVLGVFVMVETADKVNEQNRSRITANSLARELLEEARAKSFATIGAPNWFDATLTNLNGRQGNVVSPTSHSARATVERRGVSYAVEVDSCTVDDSRDGYGAHSNAANWCSDSATTAATDGQPEDLKRVAVSMTWTGKTGKPETLYQTATFGSGGQVIGPSLTALSITKPATGIDQANPVITSNPTDTPAGIVRFLGTAPGAADMKFFVEGVEQQTGVSGGNGSWTLDWNVVPLPDGVYQVSAVAIDALGARGAPRVMAVKLARGVPTPPANITGGYNHVYVAGAKTLAVELMWDASPEGSVTGYEVLKGTTVVCSASLETTCIDLTPATAGSTAYTIRTLYTDGAGNPASISNTYSVNAPPTSGGALPTQYVLKYDGSAPAYAGVKCKDATGSLGINNRYDAVPSTSWAGTTAFTVSTQRFSMCLPPMTSGGTLNAGTLVFKARWQNSNRRNACSNLPVLVYLNGTTVIAGSGVNGGPYLNLPANSAATTYTLNFTTTARTFAAGDQLSIFSMAGEFNTNCNSVTMWAGSAYGGTNAAQADFPFGSGGSGGATITRPAAPTGLSAALDADGNTALTWSPPSGTPAAEFYRIYRDGQNYTERVDTAGDTGSGTITWTDTDTGGTSHTYRVTAVSTVMAESDPAGPVTR
jgi:Tfp pilus assembly protein PilV